MRRLTILIVATAALIALLVTVHAVDGSNADHPAARETVPAPPSVGLPSSTSSTPPPHYRSGTVIKADHTDYGTVRLKVTAKHGRIVRIDVLELPHANEVDRELSKPAAQTLTHEALRGQTADVDIVSGATYTSEGYLNSLQAALDQLS